MTFRSIPVGLSIAVATLWSAAAWAQVDNADRPESEAPAPTAPEPTAAPPPSDQADTTETDPEQALVEAAARDYDQGRFEEAAAKLEEGYRLYQKPLYLFNLGQVHRLQKDCAAAEAAYRRYLDAASLQDEHRSLAAKHHTEMSACLAQATPLLPEPPPAPAPAELRVPAAPAPPAEPPSGRWMRPTGIALLATGVVAAVGATYFGLKALDLAEDNARAEYGSDAFFDSESKGRTANALAIGLGIGAAVTGGSGLTLFLLTPPVPKAAPGQSAVSRMPLLGWGGRF